MEGSSRIDNQFLKWYSIVKLVVNDFSINTVALIDSGADQNCIKGGIIPTKYCERTKEHLANANSEPLSIRYKLNKVLQWIRYPIPNKRDLLSQLYNAKLFSKFDMKSGFWQIQIAERDRYKTAFTVPFGHYE